MKNQIINAILCLFLIGNISYCVGLSISIAQIMKMISSELMTQIVAECDHRKTILETINTSDFGERNQIQ